MLSMAPVVQLGPVSPVSLGVSKPCGAGAGTPHVDHGPVVYRQSWSYLGNLSFPENGSQDLISTSLSLRQAEMKSSFKMSVELPISQWLNLLIDMLVFYIT